MSVRVLLVGSGGREHALAWKLAQSPLVEAIFAVPGNGGTAGLAPKVNNVSSVKQEDFDGLVAFAVEQRVNFLLPGPEAPLVDGIVDHFRQHGPASISIFGPSKAAARMEGSKAFSKEFMKRHNIPTSVYQTVTTLADGTAFLDAHKDKKWVIKADGLAAGKGVIIPETHEEACAALSSIMIDRDFGSAGDAVVIEEFLEGEEISILTFSDGYTFKSLPAAQDHKRINDGDQGLNTGGMGCYGPAAVATPEILRRIDLEILQPTFDGMRQERFPFVGCLFTGFMLTPTGPKVVEYNVRFGDPECQTLLPLLDSDLAEIMLACAGNYLSSIDLKISPAYSATVVVAAGGYPEKYAKGTPMTVTQPTEPGAVHFHAGTTLDETSNVLATAGGRVIASTATGSTINAAVEKAYQTVSLISFDKMHFRRDIAWRELNRQRKAPAGKSNSDSPLTYAGAGVSIDDGNTLVQRIKPFLRRTRRPGCDAEIGGFGGTISLPDANYSADSPIIVAAIDGVGTKLLIARETEIYDAVGIDLVAMNVNDLIVQGAEPLAFLDYYACSKLHVESAAKFVEGVAEGCVRSNCALIGGETAEMPGLYSIGDFDAAGCAIGALPKGKTVLPDLASMKAGDVLIGLGSSGVHSNGFSLVRRIVERSGLKYTDKAPWDQGKTLGEALMKPTKIYVRSLLKALSAKEGSIKGMAHITGGGLIDNIPRMLPKHLAAKIEVGSWPVPEVLKWLKKTGNLDHKEFATTFNTGLGMVLVVEPSAVEEVEKELRNAAEDVHRVGSLVDRGGPGNEGCVLNALTEWDKL